MLTPTRFVRHLGRLIALALLCVFSAAAPRAQAAFHLWQVQEIYSNSDASVQFIELHNNFAGENFVSGFTLTANSDGVIKTFTFPADPSGDTTNHNLLIATTGFGSLAGGVPPNFTFADGGAPTPFFNPNASNITITYSGAPDSVSFVGASFPKDGTHSLTDTNLYSTQNLVSTVNSPTNFSGQSGSVNLAPEPGAGIALLVVPMIGVLRRRRRS